MSTVSHNIDFKVASASGATSATVSSSEVKHTSSAASGHAEKKRAKPRRARLKSKVYFSDELLIDANPGKEKGGKTLTESGIRREADSENGDSVFNV